MLSHPPLTDIYYCHVVSAKHKLWLLGGIKIRNSNERKVLKLFVGKPIWLHYDFTVVKIIYYYYYFHFHIVPLKQQTVITHISVNYLRKLTFTFTL